MGRRTYPTGHSRCGRFRRTTSLAPHCHCRPSGGHHVGQLVDREPGLRSLQELRRGGGRRCCGPAGPAPSAAGSGGDQPAVLVHAADPAGQPVDVAGVAVEHEVRARARAERATVGRVPPGRPAEALAIRLDGSGQRKTLSNDLLRAGVHSLDRLDAILPKMNTGGVRVVQTTEFDGWLKDKARKAEGGNSYWSSVVDYALAELGVLRDLVSAPSENLAQLQRIRQRKRYEIWRVSHAYVDGVAVRLVCWFPPNSDSVVVVVVAGEKARIGDAFYDSVATRADVVIDSWLYQQRQHQDETNDYGAARTEEAQDGEER